MSNYYTSATLQIPTSLPPDFNSRAYVYVEPCNEFATGIVDCKLDSLVEPGNVHVKRHQRCRAARLFPMISMVRLRCSRQPCLDSVDHSRRAMPKIPIAARCHFESILLLSRVMTQKGPKFAHIQRPVCTSPVQCHPSPRES